MHASCFGTMSRCCEMVSIVTGAATSASAHWPWAGAGRLPTAASVAPDRGLRVGDLSRYSACSSAEPRHESSDRRGHRRHLHRSRGGRRGRRAGAHRQGPDHARAPGRGGRTRHPRGIARGRPARRGSRACGARHDPVHQRADRAQGRPDRADHHARLSRRHRDRARAPLRHVRSVHGTADPAGAAPSALRAERAAPLGWQRAHAARPRRGAAPDRRSARRARRGRRGVPAAQLSQSGARADGRRTAARARARDRLRAVLRGRRGDP